MERFCKVWRMLVATFAALSVLLLAAVGYYTQTLPTVFYTNEEELAVAEDLFPVHFAQEEEGGKLLLFGVIPIKSAKVTALEGSLLLPGGEVFGMKLFSEGIMLTSFADIKTPDGIRCPAKEAGLQPGDIILSADNITLKSNEHLISLVRQKRGKEMALSVLRAETALLFLVTPVLDNDGIYRLGMMVKDSSAGLGTITFYDPISGGFAGLGHPLCETDSDALIPIRQGEAMSATVKEIKKGKAGEAGELVGVFSSPIPLGSLTKNTTCGIFGQYTSPLPDKTPMAVAAPEEIKVGKAAILTTVEGNTPQEYEIRIEQINKGKNANNRNLVIRVTDKSLLAKTGGIVQGMSGSPIIQNGKLVGAVTHVLVNDPTRGYGIFIENMLEAANTVAEEHQMKDAS